MKIHKWFTAELNRKTGFIRVSGIFVFFMSTCNGVGIQGIGHILKIDTTYPERSSELSARIGRFGWSRKTGESK